MDMYLCFVSISNHLKPVFQSSLIGFFIFVFSFVLVGHEDKSCCSDFRHGKLANFTLSLTDWSNFMLSFTGVTGVGIESTKGNNGTTGGRGQF